MTVERNNESNGQKTTKAKMTGRTALCEETSIESDGDALSQSQSEDSAPKKDFEEYADLETGGICEM